MSDGSDEPNLHELGDGEFVIPAGDELLFRQVTEHQWDDQTDQPSSMAFGPSRIDQGKPSYTRETIVSAQQSRDWHQKHARSPSRGVWACSTREAELHGLRSVDDSAAPLADDEVRAPGHAYIDFRHLSKTEERITRSLLLANALTRGRIPTIDSGERAIDATSEA